MRTKLGEIARECRDKATPEEKLPIVGLEHLEPDNVELTVWDDPSTQTTFTKRFSRGQMLFGRRRAYLRKAALAPFDGLCSGDITVIEAIDGRIDPHLLPFVIQSPAFFDFAVGKSAGSLSPRVKWEHLSQFELDLPEMKKQGVIADILWAAQETKSSYRTLIEACDDVVKSQFCCRRCSA